MIIVFSSWTYFLKNNNRQGQQYSNNMSMIEKKIKQATQALEAIAQILLFIKIQHCDIKTWINVSNLNA